MYDKQLLAVFKAFKHWQHYLEGSDIPIDIVINHKNLEYFSTSQVLTCCQACQSEYLSQFNMIICFHLGHLGEKPDSLTHRWDVYPKKGDRGYAQANPQNFHLIFVSK